jgi:hypothetical protein
MRGIRWPCEVIGPRIVLPIWSCWGFPYCRRCRLSRRLRRRLCRLLRRLCRYWRRNRQRHRWLAQRKRSPCPPRELMRERSYPNAFSFHPPCSLGFRFSRSRFTTQQMRSSFPFWIAEGSAVMRKGHGGLTQRVDLELSLWRGGRVGLHVGTLNSQSGQAFRTTARSPATSARGHRTLREDPVDRRRAGPG